MSKFGGSALLCLALVSLAVPSSAQAVSEEARQHFQAGVALLQDPQKPRYEEAYREFKTAYGISPSYKILANLALCSMMLERDSEAISHYEAYIAAAAKELDPLERAQVERDLLTLKVGVVKLDIKVVPKGATIIDQRIPTQGEPVTNVYGPVDDTLKIGVRQGHHVIKARLEGRDDVTWEFDAAGGMSMSHAFELKPKISPIAAAPTVTTTRPITTPVIVLGVGTLGVGAAALVTGLFAIDNQNQYAKRNDGNEPQGAASLRSTGVTLNVVTDVMIGATVVGAIVTTALFLVRPSIVKREAFTPLSFRF
jgi:hypothetical protein